MFRGVLALSLLATAAFGGERLSAYTYESDVLAPGKGEVQADLAYRFLRANTYEQADLRTGYAVGLSQWLEAQLLLDFSIITPDVGQGSAFGLITGLLQAKVLDAHADPVGLGVLMSASAGEYGRFEARAIVDKWLGHFLLAANLSTSETIGDPVAPSRFEESLSLAYQLPTRLSVGFEVRNRQSYDDAFRFIGDALYLGPTVSLRYRKVWAATSLLMQVGAYKGKPLQGNGEPNEVIDNERFNLRLVFGADL